MRFIYPLQSYFGHKSLSLYLFFHYFTSSLVYPITSSSSSFFFFLFLFLFFFLAKKCKSHQRLILFFLAIKKFRLLRDRYSYKKKKKKKKGLYKYFSTAFTKIIVNGDISFLPLFFFFFFEPNSNLTGSIKEELCFHFI